MGGRPRRARSGLAAATHGWQKMSCCSTATRARCHRLREEATAPACPDNRELCEGTKEVKDELAAGRGGVDVLVQAAKANVAPLKRGDSVN